VLGAGTPAGIRLAHMARFLDFVGAYMLARGDYIRDQFAAQGPHEPTTACSYTPRRAQAHISG